ncbi:MAG: hypothetical protein QM753_09370 [Thermomicrobiales bacterium]
MNRLCDLIVPLAAGDDAMVHQVDDRGTVRIVWQADQLARCVSTAFGQLRFSIGQDVHLMLYNLDLLERTTRLVSPDLRGPILREAAKLRVVSLETIREPDDRARVERAAAWIDDAA